MMYSGVRRYYEAQTGQWLSEDSVQDGTNWHAFNGRRNSTAARLTSIAVAPHGTGHGLGKGLLAALERDALAAGAQRMRLEVRADNDVARKLYESARYRVVETLDEYYEDGSAALRYEKALS